MEFNEHRFKEVFGDLPEEEQRKLKGQIQGITSVINRLGK